MADMINILLRQEEEMMRIYPNENESRTGPEAPRPTGHTDYCTAAVDNPVVGVAQIKNDVNQKQLQAGDVMLRKQMKSGCPHVDRLDCMQTRERDYAKAKTGHAPSHRAHDESYGITPVEDGPDKLQTCLPSNPEVPKSDENLGAPGCGDGMQGTGRVQAPMEDPKMDFVGIMNP